MNNKVRVGGQNVQRRNGIHGKIGLDFIMVNSEQWAVIIEQIILNL